MNKPQLTSQTIRVTRQPGTVHGGLVTIGTMTLCCQLGSAAVTRLKREGDGATPAAHLHLVSLFYRADRIARPPGWYGALAEALRRDDGWCDEASDGRYNRPVTLPFAASHERLWREDALYDILGVLDWNLSPRSLGRGSAIFLHLMRPDHGPTAGCIALELPDMLKLLRLLRPGAVFDVI
jgi:L,D-peptidoglycan transpeptidase YkuD (ErfK/YbiS/YcfS/YnhG family)